MLIVQNMFVDIILRSNRLLQKPRGVFGCGGEQQITISFLEQQQQETDINYHKLSRLPISSGQ